MNIIVFFFLLRILLQLTLWLKLSFVTAESCASFGAIGGYRLCSLQLFGQIPYFHVSLYWVFNLIAFASSQDYSYQVLYGNICSTLRLPIKQKVKANAIKFLKSNIKKKKLLATLLIDSKLGLSMEQDRPKIGFA